MKTLLTRLIACIAFTFLLPTAHAGPTHELVVGFEVPPARPSKNALTLAPDGYLWGTTYGGGAHGGGNYRKGTIYKVKPDGSGMRIVYSFNYNDEFLVDVAVQPRSNSGLVDDGYGNLWGTERYGGSAESGSVFKVNVFTEIVTTVASFTNGSDSSRGANPTSNGLASDGNGFLWGTTLRGGSYGFGTVFKVNVSTGQLATVLDFPSASGTISTLVSDGRGFMWGTAGGGYLKNGEVFKINTQTGILTTVKQFTGTSGAAKGANPLGGMIRSNTGLFWGTTSRGGSSGAGTVFKIDPVTEIFTTVYEFSAANATPSYGLAADASGNIWGTSAYSVFRINPLSNAYFPIDAGVSGPGSLMIYGNTVFGTAVNRLGSVFKIDL